MIRIDRKTKILMITVIRQIYLSIHRFSRNQDEIREYLNDKNMYYQDLVNELNLILASGSLEFDDVLGKGQGRNVLLHYLCRNKFHPYDLMTIRSHVENFLSQDKHSDFIKNTEMRQIGRSLEKIYYKLIMAKFSRKQRSIISLVEHFGNNPWVGIEYLTITDVLQKLNK